MPKPIAPSPINPIGFSLMHFSPQPSRGFWTGAPCSPQRTPGFPVELPGVDELHAAFLNESRTRTRRWLPVQEIRDHGPDTIFFECFYSICHAVSGSESVGRG